MKKCLLQLMLVMSCFLLNAQKKEVDTTDIVFENGITPHKPILITLNKRDDMPAALPLYFSVTDSIFKNSGINIKRLNTMIITAHLGGDV
jgi:hypothetical protein